MFETEGVLVKNEEPKTGRIEALNV